MPLAARIGQIGRPPPAAPLAWAECSPGRFRRLLRFPCVGFFCRSGRFCPTSGCSGNCGGAAPMMSGLDRFVRVSASAPVGISVSGGPSRRMPGRARILRKNAAGLPRVPLRLVLVLRPEQVVDDLDGGESRYRTSTNTVFHRAIAPFHRPGSSMARSGLPCCDFSETNPVCGSVHCRKSKRRPR